MLKEGDRLGRYTIRRLLGKGGWGEVYEALDPELGRTVAIKRMSRELAIAPEARARFEREARAVAALDHPNIVTIHSVEEDAGERFITMQLVKGRPLDELIPSTGMPLGEIFDLAIPLADAVAAAHAKGIVHRDLKPANVMVASDGAVKVLDFGLAKLAPREDAETLVADAQTISGSVLGTLAYMSPEQLRGDEADARSDIFALGIILYELATGKTPFRGKSSVEVAASILRDRPSALSEIKAGLPRHLDRIIRTCLEEDPARRFQSALDVRNSLDQLRNEIETGVTPATPQPTAAPPPARRPHRRLVLAIAGIAALVVALTGAILVTRGRIGSETVRPAAGAAAAAAAPARVVVLPFEDRGPPSVDYFAEAITEEINSRLAAVRGLGVISRMSANQYAGTTKGARQIGEELGVDYILAGNVHWTAEGSASAQVRVAPSLIRVRDDTEIWGKGYARSINDIFLIQSEIASDVAEQLGSRLTEGSAADAERWPTSSVAAYEAYLAALHHSRRPVYTAENWDQAVAGFREAVSLDPGFVAAWAWLARAHAFVYHLRLDRSEERQRLAHEAADRALELAPDSPEPHIALAFYYYYVEQDYERALDEFGLAEGYLPNHYEVQEGKGYVQRRSGLWQEAQESLERAFQLNPLDAALAAEIADSYANDRQYGTALEWLETSIELDPDQISAFVIGARVELLRDGDLAAARAMLERMPVNDDSLAAWAWFWVELFDGRPQQALERLATVDGGWIQSPEWPQAVSLLAAQAHEVAGDGEAARRAYRAAAELLRAEIEQVPTDAHHQVSLGLAYAGLGQVGPALRHGERAVELQPISKDALSGPTYLADLALIYAKTGRAAKAVELLDQLVSTPALLSPAWLRVDPRWRQLAGEPRFQELTAEPRAG